MEQKVLFIYLHSVLLTPLPVIPVSTEEITDCNNEGAKGANKAGRNPPSCFFISRFTASRTPSTNTSDKS